MIPDAELEPVMSIDRTVEVTGGVLGQRSALHEAARRGDLPTVRVGRRVLVLTAELRRLLGLPVTTAVPERESSPDLESGPDHHHETPAALDQDGEDRGSS